MKPSANQQILSMQQSRWDILELAKEFWLQGLNQIAAEYEDQAHAMYMQIEEVYRSLYKSPSVGELTAQAYGQSELGTHVIISGGEVLELGEQEETDNIPF